MSTALAVGPPPSHTPPHSPSPTRHQSITTIGRWIDSPSPSPSLTLSYQLGSLSLSALPTAGRGVIRTFGRAPFPLHPTLPQTPSQQRENHMTWGGERCCKERVHFEFPARTEQRAVGIQYPPNYVMMSSRKGSVCQTHGWCLCLRPGIQGQEYKGRNTRAGIQGQEYN